ncbi:MAG: inositol monophosphatase [Methylobacterium mesophilicum]|nr:inositol monophosphatase [Methylobacterium mesophilicum]
MRIDDAEIRWLTALLANAADTEIMPRFRRLEAGGIRQKTSAADLVTDADEAAEAWITAKLKERFPDALVVGEEACEKDAALLPALAAADLAFTLDPVDGTFNFASGVPLFGVMLAAVENGETNAGIIYDPLTRSSTIGVRGEGATFLAPDGTRTPCHVARAVPLSGSVASVSWQYFAEPQRSLLARNSAKCLSSIGYRCAAHEYRLLASGSMHFALYNKLMPWDHLPGVLIHAEAGGHAAKLDGSPYRPGDTAGGLLLAPDEAAWAAIRRELWEG